MPPIPFPGREAHMAGPGGGGGGGLRVALYSRVPPVLRVTRPTGTDEHTGSLGPSA